MDDPINLAARRAFKQQDATLWSVLDCLRDAVRAIEAGEIDPDQCVLLLYRDREDASGRLWERQAGVTRHGKMALLSVAHHLACADYLEA
jgi:hypothetical protein